MQPLTNLLRTLSKLPGMGPRSAQRVALHVLNDSSRLTALVQALADAGTKLGTCPQCGNLAEKPSPETEALCPICASPARANGILCVVEGVADVWAMEKGGTFTGQYHVLGGVVSALNGVSPAQLRLSQLATRLQNQENPITEIILALGASIEGQTTGHLVAELAHRHAPHALLTSLAKGMPVGANVDYLDESTLTLALQHRQPLA
jgi:recombination protein RecR